MDTAPVFVTHYLFTSFVFSRVRAVERNFSLTRGTPCVFDPAHVGRDYAITLYYMGILIYYSCCNPTVVAMAT